MGLPATAACNELGDDETLKRLHALRKVSLLKVKVLGFRV